MISELWILLLQVVLAVGTIAGVWLIVSHFWNDTSRAAAPGSSAEGKMHYRCYLLNAAGRKEKALDIEAASDEDALRKASAALAMIVGSGLAEVWQGTRLVGR